MSWRRDEPRCCWQWVESGEVKAEVSDASLERADPRARQVMEACFASRNMPPLPVELLIRVTG